MSLSQNKNCFPYEIENGDNIRHSCLIKTKKNKQNKKDLEKKKKDSCYLPFHLQGLTWGVTV